MTSRIELATFQLVAHCLDQLRYFIPQIQQYWDNTAIISPLLFPT